MPERHSCNARHFSWLMKSCFPNPNQSTFSPSKPNSKPSTFFSSHYYSNSNPTATTATSISSLPDDLLLEFLSRVPPSSLPSLTLVCRRWSRLLNSSDFSDLRRRRSLIRYTVFSLTLTDSGLCAASLADNGVWNTASLCLPQYDAVSIVNFHSLLSHARLCSVGPRIYIIGKNDTVCYDTWTRKLATRSPMIFPRKKFAAAVVSGKIYVAGGGSRTTALEEYDPIADSWSVVSESPRRRYGCIGASADGVFYVIGGLQIGASEGNEISRAASGTASSMDLFDVEGRSWMRSRAVPGGGCVVAACAAGGFIYVLASHAVELSFWSFVACRKTCNSGGGGCGGPGFGGWRRIKSPPLAAKVSIDSRVRFSFVGMRDKVVLIQHCSRESVIVLYDCVAGEWSRGAELPEVFRRAAFVSVEC